MNEYIESLKKENERHKKKGKEILKRAGFLEVIQKSNKLEDEIGKFGEAKEDLRETLGKAINSIHSRKRASNVTSSSTYYKGFEEHERKQGVTLRDDGIFYYNQDRALSLGKITGLKEDAIIDCFEDDSKRKLVSELINSVGNKPNPDRRIERSLDDNNHFEKIKVLTSFRGVKVKFVYGKKSGKRPSLPKRVPENVKEAMKNISIVKDMLMVRDELVEILDERIKEEGEGESDIRETEEKIVEKSSEYLVEDIL